jgi:plastocyanin
MHMRQFATLVAALALVLAAAACGGGGSSSGNAGESGSGKTEVELDDNYFQPKTIQGKPGDTITLELKNEGSAEHNFTIDGQSVDQDVEPGDEAEVDITIPQSGSVQFYCKYHKAEGMTGTLEASGSASSGSSGPGTNGKNTDYSSG